MRYVFGGHMLAGEFRPVWERHAGGAVLGSFGAFLVIEASDTARERAARPFARLTTVVSDRSQRKAGDVTAQLRRLWDQLAPRLDPAHVAVISGATGVEPATSEERAFLADHPDVAVRAPASYFGLGPEPQFLMNVAIAALAVSHGRLFPPADQSGVERPAEDAVTQAVVTSVGQWRGEGMALVEAVG